MKIHEVPSDFQVHEGSTSQVTVESEPGTLKAAAEAGEELRRALPEASVAVVGLREVARPEAQCI